MYGCNFIYKKQRDYKSIRLPYIALFTIFDCMKDGAESNGAVSIAAYSAESIFTQSSCFNTSPGITHAVKGVLVEMMALGLVASWVWIQCSSATQLQTD